MNYKIDIKRITDGNFHIEGWVLPKDFYEDVQFKIFLKTTNGDREVNNFKCARCHRNDIYELYVAKEISNANDKKDKEKNDNKKNDYFGFCIEIPIDCNEDNDKMNIKKNVVIDDIEYKIIIETNNEKAVEKISKKICDIFNSYKHKKIEQFIAYFNINTFKRAFEFLLKEGIFEFYKKTIRKIKGINVDYDYMEWYELTKTTEEDLQRQKNDKSFKFRPFFSIVIPVYDTKTEFLKMLFDSIFNQTYDNFEICVVDATDYKKNKNNPKKFFESLADTNYDLQKLHIKYIEENKSIADNTNIAINMCRGDYIVLCDHDDELTLDALYENVKVINENRNALLIYSDEDKVDTKSNDYFEPAFKSDFNIDMLLSVNYFCHLTVIKKELLDKLYKIDGAYERGEYNGAQDYDLFLRLVNLIISEYDIKDIYHIKKVLYHWRCHKDSTSKNVESKSYAFESGARAIEDFYKKTKMDFEGVDHVERGFDFGLYRTIYKKIDDEPLVSVIIPNKDHIDDLTTMISSFRNGNYKNLEFVICENNSENHETFDYYDKIKNDSDIKIVYYKDKFNYSKINNYAVKHANADYILFANNDIEMINKNSIFEMLSYIKRSDVGAVGAKLLYKDKTIQHAGVILGIGGVAGHAFVSLNDFDHSYMNRAHIVQDYSAVTAACLMTKKSILDDIGGFDEDIAVAFNDIDLCIKIREHGKLIVYTPYAEFFHYESKSRGYEDTKEKVDRFNRETAFILKKWPNVLYKIDEYYNPNLTLRKQDFSLRNLKYEKIGEPYIIPNEIKEIIKTI